VVYAARCELARTVDDVLSRRTRMRLFARDLSVKAAPEVGRLLQRELGLSDEEVARQVDDYVSGVEREKTVLMEGLS
jgi:glycerol-3-phosphate dehydrogenase